MGINEINTYIEQNSSTIVLIGMSPFIIKNFINIWLINKRDGTIYNIWLTNLITASWEKTEFVLEVFLRFYWRLNGQNDILKIIVNTLGIIFGIFWIIFFLLEVLSI